MAAMGDTVTITVTRDSSTTGQALLGKFSCSGLNGHTLENKDHTWKVKTGEYRAKLYYSPKFKRTVIRLNDNDTGREGIEIHVGNYARDSEGCILVGSSRGKDPKNKSDGAVENSKVTLDSLINKCQNKTIKVVVK
mmetsp:Transcript_20703/g.18275  ORF Transcript_20703/g.18275 Transcript_20703/m.18275 type:complete len:136 (+) Transcript_20703:84-491(+)